jgi:hypothetical protein
MWGKCEGIWCCLRNKAFIPLLRGRPSQGKIERKYNSIPPSTFTTFQFTPLNIKIIIVIIKKVALMDTSNYHFISNRVLYQMLK